MKKPDTKWRMPVILPLTLTRHWFTEIASGRKTEEFRHRKPYWQARLTSYSTTLGRAYRQFDEVHFTNGYGPTRPFMRVECQGITEKESGLPAYGFCYAIQLGKILELRNYGPSGTDHTHEWHVVTRLPNGWQDVCVTCGAHQIVHLNTSDLVAHKERQP